jgi:hypothetical protein
MNSFLEIDNSHIEKLNTEQFLKLLRLLLYLEASNIGIPFSDVSVPLNINSSDEGEDASITWELFDKSEKKSEWIKRNYTIFQSKAYSITPAKCFAEIFEKPKSKQSSKEKKKLKKAIQNVLDKKGSYILFVKSSYTHTAIENRIKKIKEGLKEVGKNINNINLDIYDANKIAVWSNKYPQSALFISSCNKGFRLSPNFKTWEELSNYDTFSGDFITNDKLNEHISGIVDCSTGLKNILRIIGLSGLGKTRLILEAFRPPPFTYNLKKELISNSFMYYNAEDSKTTLIENLHYIISSGMSGTLVVDNCSTDLHEKLLNEISRKNSKINLITVDFIEDSPYEPTNYKQIRITNTDYLDIIPKMLELAFPDISAQDREKINTFVNGFPMLAFELGRQMKSNYNSLGVITADNIVNKIIWGRGEVDKEEKAVLICCSLFDKFGFYEELEKQMKFISSNSDLCKLPDHIKNPTDFFKKVCNKFIKRGILEKRGRFLIMKPKPLAVTLAAEWWREFDNAVFEDIFGKLKNNELDIYLSDQMRYLDFLPEAKEFVSYLSSDKGPFGKAETLNTEEGSRFFRSLVEVNPHVTCDTLFKLYYEKDINYIKEKVVKGRRNLVWAIEKLCWRKETFNKAVKILLLFAVGENEKWANNATGIFKHLFQVLLPGTEVSLEERYKILEYGISKSDSYKKITIEAIKNALKTDYFTRDVGAENQGMSKTLKDFRPTFFERNEYWKKCLSLLKNEWMNDSDFKSNIEAIIVASIRGLVSQGLGNIILPLIKELSEIKNYDWIEARNNLKLTLNYEKNIIIPDNEKIINELIEKLTPIDIFKRYELFVNNPGWEVTRDENGKYIDKWKINTEKFVVELIKNESEWKKLIDVFYVGRQIQGFDFGEELGKIMKETGEFNEFIKLSISKIESIEKEKRNIVVLIGFLNGLDDRDLNDKLIKLFINNDKLVSSSFRLASGVIFNSSLLIDFLNLVKQNSEYINNLLELKYCRSFDNFSDGEILNFIGNLFTINSDAHYISFSLLYHICWRNKTRLDSFKVLFRKILLQKSLILYISEKDPSDLLEWKEIAEKILSNCSDNEFAIHVMKEMINFLRKDGIRFDIYIQDIMRILLNKYFLIVWPYIGETLLEDSIIYIDIGHFIGSRIEFENENLPDDIRKKDKERNGLLFKNNNEMVMEWCINNSPKAPLRLARFIPIFDEKEGEKWHPFTLSFIDNFGTNKNILNEISANMSTYSWTGSIVPLLESEKKLYEQLQEHPLLSVRKWAQQNIDYLVKSIKRESNEDQELYI